VNAPEQPPVAVIQHFSPAVSGLSWHRVDGGFSGAVVWRGDDIGTPRVALKAWPLDTSAERLQQIHLWMSQAAHLLFVPNLISASHGRGTVLEGGRVWDACRWMPGEPRHPPTAAEVVTACEAVASLHGAWAKEERRPCRGVTARLAILSDFRPLLDRGEGALPAVNPELDPLLRRAVCVVARFADSAVAALRPWSSWPMIAQPCVRDLRGEHVLFEDGRVSGLIDYGAMAIDHPAVDLARLLTDYAGADDERFDSGLNAYRSAGGKLDTPDDFVHLLSRTGAICSLLGWVVRLVVRQEPVKQALPVVVRMLRLLAHVEAFTHL